MNNNKITPRLSDIDTAMNQPSIPNADEFFSRQTVIKNDIVPRRQQIQAKLPEDAIIRHDDGTMSIGRFIMTDYGLEVPDDIEKPDFGVLFDVLFKVRDRINLWIGDALAAFERLNYGSAETIADYFGYEVATIWNLKSICSSVKTSRRREVLEQIFEIKPDVKPLSLSHYDAIKSLKPDQQNEFMRQALLNNWTVKQLRQEIRALSQADVEIPPPAVEKRNRISSQMQDSLKLDMPLSEHMEYIAMYERGIEAHKKIMKQLRHDRT